MQYNCLACHDTGSISKHMTGNLDCISCDVATDRVALEAFVDKLPAMGEQEQAWRIHQRALAMAPKQEAPAGWKLVPEDPTGDMFRAAAKIDNEMFAGGSSHGAEDGQVWAAMYDAAPEAPIAAPAAANGALTDDQINTIWESLPGLKIVAGRPIDHWNSLLRHEFARAILAAAGPDAALVKALESALAIINNEADPKEYATPLKAIRAALSGAKGN